MTEEKKKNYLNDHSDCYLCSTSTLPSSNLNLPETQNFFYNPSDYLRTPNDPLLSQSAASADVDECGIYPFDFEPKEDGRFNGNGTSLPVNKPSSLFCASNEFTKVLNRFQALLYNLELSINELSLISNPPPKEKRNIRELNSLLGRLQRIKDQTLMAQKKMDRLISQSINP